jgi:uncharacterized membrane protein
VGAKLLKAIARLLRRRGLSLPGKLLPGGKSSDDAREEIEPAHEADLPEALKQADGLPVQCATLVAVPVEIAYNQFTQFEDFPSFTRSLVHVDQVSPVQAEFELGRFWGRRRWRAHVVDQRPDERIAWRSVNGVGLAGVTTFHSLSDRLTRVDVSVVVGPSGGLQRLARRLGLVERLIAGELHRFKAFIEMREQETGAWRGYIADGEVVDEEEYFGWEQEEGSRHGDAEEGASGDAASSNGKPSRAQARSRTVAGNKATEGNSKRRASDGSRSRA